MAEKRMFSKKITESDFFLDLSLSAQALYFHLSLNADDDGMVSAPKKVMKMIGASEEDLAALIDRRFIIAFPSGVVAVKHWHINNYIRTDRYKPTTFLEELSQLTLKENGGYTIGIPSDNLDKNSIDKNRLDKYRRDRELPLYDPSTNPEVDEERVKELMERRMA